MNARPAGGALALALALLATAALATDALEPYRALARSAAGERVLALARAEITRALEPASLAAISPPAAGAAPDSTAPDWPGAPCGVYLSLAHGTATRACVGSLTPLGTTLAETLRELARQIVASDPRHPPLRRGEPDSLRVVVAFAGTPVAVADPMQVSPAREGLLIATPAGNVAFLPGEARTVSWALREARRIGLLAPTSDASYQSFPVVTLQDPSAR